MSNLLLHLACAVLVVVLVCVALLVAVKCSYKPPEIKPPPDLRIGEKATHRLNKNKVLLIVAEEHLANGTHCITVRASEPPRPIGTLAETMDHSEDKDAVLVTYIFRDFELIPLPD